MDIIALLKAERDKAAQQVNALDAAIKALSGLNSTGVKRGRQKMSAAARATISASQKARWARARGQKVVSIAPSAASHQRDSRGSERQLNAFTCCAALSRSVFNSAIMSMCSP